MTELRRKNPITLLCWLLPTLVALALRLAYMMQIRELVLFDAPIMDAAVHDGWARGTLSLFYEGVAYFRAPLYPWFLQLVYALDESYLAPRIAQAILSSLSVAFVADGGRRLAGPAAGLAGGLLLALCWPVIYFSGELLIVTFFMFVVAAALWLFVRAGDEDRPSMAYVAAFLLGLSAIARPTSLVFIPALIALPMWLWPRLGLENFAAHRVRHALLLVVLALAPGLALTARNVVVGGDTVFIASQGGVNFYIGNNAASDGRTAVVPGTSGTWLGGYRETIAQANAAAGRPLKPSEVSRYYFAKGLRYWVEEPGDALMLYARKLRLILGAAERSNNQNLHYWRAESSLLRLPVYTSFASLAALGLVGIWLCRRRAAMWPVAAFLGLYALGLLLFFVNERFRIPLTIVFAFTAGIPVAQLISAVRAKAFRAVTVIATAVLVLMLISSLDRIGFKGDRIDADAFSRYSVGNAYLAKRQATKALGYYRDSLRVARKFNLKNFEPVELRLRMNMVRGLRRLADPDGMEIELAYIEGVAPRHPDTRSLRADAFSVRKRFDRAKPLYRGVLAEVPNHLEATLGMAWCSVGEKGYSQARQFFQTALRLDPGNPTAITGLGVCDLWGRQNRVDARKRFEQALAIDHVQPFAHFLMGELERQDKNLPKMAFHFREAHRFDPFNTTVSRFINRSGMSKTHLSDVEMVVP